MTARVLVAGIGNVFYRDDGFGVAVANYLLERPLPEGMVVRDVGIRGLHLAYDLADGWDALVAIDAVSMGASPGTLRLVEPGRESERARPVSAGHGIDLASILSMAHALGAVPPVVLLVGCEVSDVSEGMGLTLEVASAIPAAARMVESAIADRLRDLRSSPKTSSTLAKEARS